VQTALAEPADFLRASADQWPMEGLNDAIQGLIKKAFGHRNKERIKTIFFHYGALNLYPAQ
jgi:hypothetical protein